MKRFFWFICVSLLTLITVSETTNWFQHQQHIKVAGSGEHTLLAGHSLIMRLTFTNGVRFCHRGEPLHVTALAVKRLLDSDLQPPSVVLSVAPQAFEKASHLERIAVKAFAIEKEMELARSLSLFQLLNPKFDVPQRWQALRWKFIPFYSPEMAPADSFFIPPEGMEAWMELSEKRRKQWMAAQEHEHDWVWDGSCLKNLQLLLHTAQEHDIPIIGLIAPQQTLSWNRIPAEFEQKWRSTLADLEALHESFFVVDFGQSPALPPECFTDPVHLSHIGSAAIRDTLENIVHQIEKRQHQ